MKQKVSRVVALIVLIFFVFTISGRGSAQMIQTAPGAETLITTLMEESPQTAGKISGEYLLWISPENCDSDLPLCCSDNKPSHIFLYHIPTGNETVLCDVTSDLEPWSPSLSEGNIVYAESSDSELYTIKQFNPLAELETIKQDIPLMGTDESPYPRISGDMVVWQEYDSDSGAFDIYTSSSPEPIENDINFDSLYYGPKPDISGNTIVWQAYNNTIEGYDIYIDSVADGSSEVIGSAPTANGYPPLPRISDSAVVWQSYNNNYFDIFYDTPDDVPIRISTTMCESDGAYPTISGKNIVWTDCGDIFLYDITIPDTLFKITEDASIQTYPEISGNRIIWWDDRNGEWDIYLFTLGEDIGQCPQMDFSPAISCDDSPLTVDLSYQNVDSSFFQHWNFGDETYSLDPVTSHSFTDPGIYTISLTASNATCRDAVKRTINAGSAPIASFEEDSPDGYAPLSVNFTDTSTGCIDQWVWDFGDGETSYEQHPPHTFHHGGSYPVTLTVSNNIGDDSSTKTIYVFNRTGEDVHTAIEGLIITGDVGTQSVTFDTSVFPHYSSNSTHLRFEPPPGYGIAEITFVSNGGSGFTDIDGIITGEITRVLLTSNPIPLGIIHETIGVNATVWYELNLSAYPLDATIIASAWEGGISDDIRTIDATASAYNYGGIRGVAYEIQFEKTNLDIPHSATITMTVNPSWVSSHGGLNAVRIVRMADNKVILLPTSLDHYNHVENLDYFMGTSPMGLSRFVLTALFKAGNPLQIVVLTAQQWFDGGGGGDDYVVGPIETVTTTEPLTPATAIPTTLPEQETTSTPESLGQAIIEEPIPTTTLLMIESPSIPVPPTQTPLPPFIPLIAWAAAGMLWMVKRKK